MKEKIEKAYGAIIWWVGVVATGVIFGVTIQFANAWVNPPGNPPAGNIGAPINTGSIGQAKNGNLVLNALGEYIYGLVVNGRAWVKGSLRITDGTEGAGKVLTSNDNGVASWREAKDGDFSDECGWVIPPGGDHAPCESNIVKDSIADFNRKFPDADLNCSGGNNQVKMLEINNAKYYVGSLGFQGCGSSGTAGCVGKVKYCKK